MIFFCFSHIIFAWKSIGKALAIFKNTQGKGMNPQIQRPPTSWPLIILFLIIIFSVSIAGITYYNYQKDNLMTEKLQELSAISDLKIRQITQWRFERLADGRFLGDDIMLQQRITEYLKHPSNTWAHKTTQRMLKSLTENFDYRSALLLDQKGKAETCLSSQGYCHRG